VLPFLEYDLHRQLMLKLRVQGRNAVFALKAQLQVSIYQSINGDLGKAYSVRYLSLSMNE